MLTSLRVQRFKRFEDTGEIPLDRAVVFVGPNNSGKTTALQALSLWHLGVNKWQEKRGPKSTASEKTGVALNRKDVLTIPTPNAKLLWYNLVTKGKKSEKVLITITVKGITDGEEWECGMDFDYFGEEVLYCRPNRTGSGNVLISSPGLLNGIRIAYLPPMSGLIAQEPKILPSTVNARIGEGRTAEVLRNLCYFILYPETPAQINGKATAERLSEQDIQKITANNWRTFTNSIKAHFGVTLEEPYLNERGELEMYYKDMDKNRLEITSSGRGLQQVMLLLAYMHSHPASVILFDEPDAHLEILRQRQTYSLIEEVAREHHSQIVVASHSEVILQEAAGKDVVIAFTGKPHRINDKVSQLMKSLTTIGFEQYYLAELKKWILYLEGPTDLAMLQAFAKKLKHPAEKDLEGAFVEYVATNLPNKVREHFNGIKEAEPALKGIAIFDRIGNPLQPTGALIEMMWSRRELENYFYLPEVLLNYAGQKEEFDLFSQHQREQRMGGMQQAIELIVPPIAIRDKMDVYWKDSKASDEMERILKEYFSLLGSPGNSSKNKYYELIKWMDAKTIDYEVTEKLDAIASVAQSAIQPS